MAEPIDAFQFPIQIDAAKGELRKERDYSAYVGQLIRQVLLTAPGERVNRPDFGAGLRRMVFAPISEETATLLQTTVFQSLDRWLGTLIKIDEVRVSSTEPGTLQVDIVYTLKARGTQEVINLEVTN